MGQSARRVSILVVDDEPDVADLFRQHSRRESRQGIYVMHFAASGAEALDRLSGEIRPALVAVLSDINMPEMDGLQLLAEIKQRGRGPHSALYPVIAQLERAAGFARDDAVEVKLDKLQALLTLATAGNQEVALLAEILPISGRPAAELKVALDRLTGSGLLLCRGTPPHAVYQFKHAPLAAPILMNGIEPFVGASRCQHRLAGGGSSHERTRLCSLIPC